MISILILFLGVFFFASPTEALFDDFIKKIKKATSRFAKGEMSDNLIISGLKEALEIGTGNAIDFTGKENGYFLNPEIKIPFPEKIQNVGNALNQAGYGKQVDTFVLSMNRAAENSVPKAKEVFWSAIQKMNFEDAKKIYKGNETAATQFFQEKNQGKLYDLFKPSVQESMKQVGVTQSYQGLFVKIASLPLINVEGSSLDLDHYVTEKALAGLFHIVGEEEKKIRTDPAARVTDILKQVFGKK